MRPEYLNEQSDSRAKSWQEGAICGSPTGAFPSSRRQRQQDVGIPSAIETERLVEDLVACADIEPRRVNPEQSPR